MSVLYFFQGSAHLSRTFKKMFGLKLLDIYPNVSGLSVFLINLRQISIALINLYVNNYITETFGSNNRNFGQSRKIAIIFKNCQIVQVKIEK